ncbi:uncharacterized protein A1O5_12941 [Cladophialophora psammophila CBS 110553]|uniref:Major facilitator superfamily (MFS) profile domain-containing protein n=1 Tax=Cladophialophora psammophila CBS 110553 TaxID=1182543 RepID=W9VPE9_9EURO|nr:uncharacterized protein A1O5_12941 [Cladophialophora psammophila CBS 110553]EXJ54875.1 hypothetical protein A1O5_12941 [Cladophialophora psammophila CBS 110553]
MSAAGRFKLNSLRQFLRPDDNNIAEQSRESTVLESTDDKNTATHAHDPISSSNGSDEVQPELPAQDAQEGVRRVEAITLAWSKTSLIITYICFYLLYFVNAFQFSITANLTPYVTSGFEYHSLIPVIYIVSSVMTGAAYLPIAKMLDIWGRPEAFLFMVSLGTLGLILQAACTNIQTFCAAQVFTSIGFTGMIYSVDVMTADTSKLKNRGLAFAFTSSPYMVTAFAGPSASEGFYEDINWRWAFGTFAIVTPFVAAPLYFVMQYNLRKAKKQGLLDRPKSGRTLFQSIWFYIIEFDAFGVILLATGLVLFLLPFSLAQSTADDWESGSIIAMLVVGFVLLLAFVVFERYLAPKPFTPYQLLVSRTILGALLLDAVYQIAYYCWGSYFSSFLQVVNNLTIAQAGYVSSTFDIISGLWLLFVGFLMRVTGRFKWLLLCAVPLYMLGVGLMIHFRRPHTNIGYIIMCQILIAFAGSTMILCQQVAVMAAAEHGQIAAVLAMLGLFGYMGGAVGNSICGAIWTHSLPSALQRLLPENLKPEWETIYGDLTVQLSYPMGSPAREAIMEAYGIAQRRMLIAGTSVMGLALFFVLMIRDINISKNAQVKGVVF